MIINPLCIWFFCLPLIRQLPEAKKANFQPFPLCLTCQADLSDYAARQARQALGSAKKDGNCDLLDFNILMQ